MRALEYRDWRNRANAYLGQHGDVGRWSLSYVLATLRHSLAGSHLWAEARSANFWER